LSGVEPQNIANDRLDEQEKSQLELAKKKLNDYQLTINAEACKSIDILVEYCIQQIKNQGVKVIILDFLQMLNYKYLRRYNRDVEIDEICKKLKELAKEHKVCIIAASSLNRGVENRIGSDGKRPQLCDLRDSGSIEQMADKVLFLHRPEYYRMFVDERGDSLTGVLEVIVAKNIAGIVGDIRLMLSNNRLTIEESISISDNFIDKIKELGIEMSNEVPF